jgi:Tol biopolymer transport system component/DNA-binding winged helix-turn-helix (wHTH) protein
MSLNLDFISTEFNLKIRSNSESKAYLFEGYRLDVQRRMLYRGEREVVLPPKAIETLTALIELRGQIVSKGDLMKIIWADTIVEESNLDHYLHVLRKALGQKSDGQSFIETLRRRGYRFTSNVQVIEAPNSNGTQLAPANSDLAQLTDRESEDPNGSSGSASEYPVQSSAQVVKRSSFSPLTGVIAVLAGLFGSAATWYFQRENLPNPVGSLSGRGEISITALTNGNAVSDATISSDGKYFVYYDLAENKQHLWVQQVGQTVRIEITPPDEWTFQWPTFSPTAEHVYFVAQEKPGDQYALYRVSTLGGAPVKILNVVHSPVSFSHDGRQLAFIRYNEQTKEYQLVAAAVDGSAERILLTRSGRERLSPGLAWSPDGKSIAYEAMDTNSTSSEGTCSIAAIELASLTTKNLSPERWDTCYRMAWTSDGQGLIFIGTRAGETYTTRRDQVYYLSVTDGQSRRISTDGSRYQSASLGLTTDNALLAVPHKRLSQIWVMDADGNARTAVQLTNGQLDGPSGIAPLPDGRVGYVSRVGEDLTLWVMNPDGSDQHQIGLAMPLVEELRATPDGRFFIFSARRDGFSHLYRIDTNGRDLRQLTVGESDEISSTISPDSKSVYYFAGVRDRERRKTYLRKISIDGGETVNLKEMDNDLVPELSPDGKLIASLAGGKLRILSSSDGALVRSVEADKLAHPWGGAKWTTDGESLIYLVPRGNTSNLWVQAVSGSAPRQLTTFPRGSVYEYAFSRDGKKLYVAHGYQIRDAVLIKNF